MTKLKPSKIPKINCLSHQSNKRGKGYIQLHLFIYLNSFFNIYINQLNQINCNTERERETETHPTQREKLCFLFPENYEKYENLLFVSQNRVGLERERKESICVCLCVREGGERNVR